MPASRNSSASRAGSPTRKLHVGAKRVNSSIQPRRKKYERRPACIGAKFHRTSAVFRSRCRPNVVPSRRARRVTGSSISSACPQGGTPRLVVQRRPKVATLSPYLDPRRMPAGADCQQSVMHDTPSRATCQPSAATSVAQQITGGAAAPIAESTPAVGGSFAHVHLVVRLTMRRPLQIRRSNAGAVNTACRRGTAVATTASQLAQRQWSRRQAPTLPRLNSDQEGLTSAGAAWLLGGIGGLQHFAAVKRHQADKRVFLLVTRMPHGRSTSEIRHSMKAFDRSSYRARR